MKFKYTILLLMVLVVCFFQCKKKKDPVVDPTPPSTAYTDVCTPKTGNTQYIPLAKGNTWVYKTTISGFPATITSTLTKDTTVTGGKTYFVASYTPNLLPSSYQRYNSGDSLIGLNPDSLAVGKLKEELLIPANPTNNQSWVDSKGTTYTVMSTTSIISINGCDYSNLLEIQVDSPSTSSNTTYYYKQGIGLISISCNSGCNFTTANLNSMSLY